MPTKSPWQLPIPEISVPTFLFGPPDQRRLPDRPVFIETERPNEMVITHQMYRQWSRRFAAGLRAAGLKKGEPVLLFSGNTIFFPIVIIGTIMAGGIFTGANPTYNARELAFQLQNSGARFLICSDAQLDAGLEAASTAGLPKERVFVFDNGFDTWDGRGRGARGCKHWTALVSQEPAAETFQWDEGAGVADRTIALNYSSGTTGLPKGVEITHKNYVANTTQHMLTFTQCKDYTDPALSHRWLNFLPLYHAMAQTIYCCGGPYLGAPVYMMRKFDFHAMLQAIQDFRITRVMVVPPIVVAMAKHPDVKKFDLSSIRNVASGAAPLGREIIVEFERLWPNAQVNLHQGWGMTEVTCAGTVWDPTLHCANNSIGDPVCNTEIKLVDDKLAEVARGERGEILIRGPNIMKGYWNNPKATAETLLDGGWLRTGDVAYQDKNGHFFVVDRIKELIKVKGLQVAPAELEAQLLEHPAVSDACVIGVTVDGEELPRAYVVLTAGKKAEPQEIATWMEGKVSKHKRLIGGVKFVDAILKNPSGKILRRQYREMAQNEVGDSAKKEAKM